MTAATNHTALANGQTIAGVDRSLPSYLGEAGGMTLGVTEIAEGLGLSRAVVQRILSSLRSIGFELDPHTRRHRHGPPTMSLGLTWPDRVDGRPVTRTSRAALAASAHRGDHDAIDSLRMDQAKRQKVTADRDIKMVAQVGRAILLHAGAFSTALLAFLDSLEQQAHLDRRPLPAVTAGKVSDQRAVRDELDHIRDIGYAVLFGERDTSAGSVAAPVHGPSRRPQAVASGARPREWFRDDADQLIALVPDTTREMAAQLGGSIGSHL